MTPTSLSNDIPYWRLNPNLPIKYVLASDSATKAVVLWEQTMTFTSEVWSMIICGPDGERLSPIYRQKHHKFQAAFPVHEGDHIVIYHEKFGLPPVINVYVITSTQDYPCRAGNRKEPTEWYIGALSIPRCPDCNEPLVDWGGGTLKHPKAKGWIRKARTSKPCVCLSIVSDPGEMFLKAIEAATHKAKQALAGQTKIAPAYVRLD